MRRHSTQYRYYVRGCGLGILATMVWLILAIHDHIIIGLIVADMLVLLPCPPRSIEEDSYG